MPSNENRRWDIGDEVVTRSAVARPLRNVIVSSAAQIVFTVLAITGPSVLPALTSHPHSVIQRIRIPRRDIQRESRRPTGIADARVGISTGRLANLFPVYFRPSDDEDEGEPFFMS